MSLGSNELVSTQAEQEQPVRVAMWSGPRNISTAMMRSWENRPDALVADEPLYSAYLTRTGLDHPAREEVIASQPSDLGEAITVLSEPLPRGRTIHYAKHMAQHLAPDDDLAWVHQFRNILLIRHPAEVVSSYVKSREACEPDDIGLVQQARLWEELTAANAEVPVIDATDFLQDPESYLRWVCEWLGIQFTDRMLAWPAGPRDSDGVWAPHWYHAVWSSTGFAPWHPREVHLSEHDAAVAQACVPAYDMLHSHRLVLPPR